jgi:hypothetical protein
MKKIHSSLFALRIGSTNYNLKVKSLFALCMIAKLLGQETGSQNLSDVVGFVCRICVGWPEYLKIKLNLPAG